MIPCLPGCFKGVTDTGAPSYDLDKAKEYMEASGLNRADCDICDHSGLDDTKLRNGSGDPELPEGKSLGLIPTILESMDLVNDICGCDSHRSTDQEANGNYTGFLVTGLFPGCLPFHVREWIQ